jgi:transcriptional regulator with XRE-family HTH domain
MQLAVGDIMIGLGNPTVRRRVLGMKLRQLRMTAGVTIDQVAVAIEGSKSKVSRIETGNVSASPRDVRDMLELYGIAGEQWEELLQAARDAREKGWWHAYSDVLPATSPYIGMEAAAAQIRTYEALLVPGLLQTAAYARTAIRVLHPMLRPYEVDRWVELRQVRQALLAQHDPPAISAIVDEAVLRRPVGGRSVMREQLRRLFDDGARVAVTLRVLPFEAGEHAAMYGSFTILGFQDPAQPDVVYVENLARELCLEKAEELLNYSRAFDHLQALALDPDASAALLARLGEEL